MTPESMVNWIKKYEGFRSHPYLDTVGKVTIGYGRNIDDNGITESEASYLLMNDLEKSYSDMSGCPWFNYMPEAVKDALINMCFNLGFSRLLGFNKMIAALIECDYSTAAKESLNSKWAEQVGQRAKDIAVMIREAK